MFSMLSDEQTKGWDCEAQVVRLGPNEPVVENKPSGSLLAVVLQ